MRGRASNSTTGANGDALTLNANWPKWCMRPEFAAARSTLHGMPLIGMRFTREQLFIETLHNN
ncbi:unnamed protein product [Penicillium roqueforti FM164]|uniref:Genomic scaffold, ProqFM164S02 n=1 Tax=Penicillium roqueforti (strain FM164) TaxID=1365484 RepID=W6Q912_PENRF|nr:unnamed protein product [Penicillium roqueforti FM164]